MRHSGHPSPRRLKVKANRALLRQSQARLAKPSRMAPAFAKDSSKANAITQAWRANQAPTNAGKWMPEAVCAERIATAPTIADATKRNGYHSRSKAPVSTATRRFGRGIDRGGIPPLSLRSTLPPREASPPTTTSRLQHPTPQQLLLAFRLSQRRPSQDKSQPPLANQYLTPYGRQSADPTPQPRRSQCEHENRSSGFGPYNHTIWPTPIFLSTMDDQFPSHYVGRSQWASTTSQMNFT